MLKRHAIQVLRQAGHTLDEIAEHVAVGKRSVQRVLGEPVIRHHDTEHECTQRAIGRAEKKTSPIHRRQRSGWNAVTAEHPQARYSDLDRRELVVEHR